MSSRSRQPKPPRKRLLNGVQGLYPAHEPSQVLRCLAQRVLHDALGLPRSEPPLDPAVEQELVQAWVEAITEEPFADHIGEIYMELASCGMKQWLGQYFTPFPVASLIARINLAGGLPAKPQVSVAEPACGSGVLVLAFLAEVHAMGGAEALGRLRIWMNDLDATCAWVAAAQVVLLLMRLRASVAELHVTIGNGLTDDQRTILRATANPQATEPDAEHQEAACQALAT